MRIAIVGAGVSGLVSAWLLHPRHDVTVLEANDYAGGHTHSVEVQLAEGRVAVDTGFIVYNERNYPLFSALLARLGVPSQPSEMSFSVCDPARRLEFRTTNANTLFARRANLLRPGYLAMLGEIVRFNRTARRLLEGASGAFGRNGAHGAGDGAGASGALPTLGEVLESGGWSRRLREDFVVPLGSSIWSADPDHFEEMPFSTYARFMDNHGLLSFGEQPGWRTVRGGAARYVEALVGRIGGRVRLSTPVDKLVRDRGGVEVHLAEGGSERYDAVVLACHSNEALALLSDPTPAEEEVLGAIGYVANDAVLHTDESLMPASRRAWASWNYHVANHQAAEPRRCHTGGGALRPAPGHLLDEGRRRVPLGLAPRRATLTYHMNRLQSIAAPEQLFVTLNRVEAIDPRRVLARFSYSHPVLDGAAVAAQARRHELQGVARTFYCGAYWGFGFHEDGVRSAHLACRALERSATFAESA